GDDDDSAGPGDDDDSAGPGDDDDSAGPGDDDDSAGSDEDADGDGVSVDEDCDDNDPGMGICPKPSCAYLSFDGVDDFVEVADHSSLALAGQDYTMEFWVLLDGAHGSVVVSKRSNGFFTGYLLGTGPDAVAGCCDGSSVSRFGAAPGAHDFWNPVDITWGWHHIALTHDAAAQVSRFWVGGQVVAETSSYSSLVANDSSLWLARERINTAQYAQFSLAGVRLSSEVLYSDTFIPEYPLLARPETVASWPMDEGWGGLLYDGSANDNHGVLTGGTWAACP
ncbi:MAG: hypothetical protein CMP23_16990, partial [Rickettsiales bacterium]|nr:hypothetical protein [Rickettsiales bacterium]